MPKSRARPRLPMNSSASAKQAPHPGPDQSAAEIEARKAEAAISNLVAEAMLAFARLSAAVRRAHSVEDDGRRV